MNQGGIRGFANEIGLLFGSPGLAIAAMNLSRIILVSVLCIFLSQTVFADWVKQESGTLAWLHSIYFVDDDNGWIVGSNGTLLSTRDGGRTWQKEKTKTGDTFRDVYFADRQNGWILCERSVYRSGGARPSYLMRTWNGGKDWESVDFAEGKERMVRFFFSRNGTGFAIGEGGVILQMQNDNENWKRLPLPIRYLILDGMFTDELNGILVGGGGTILNTTNGGATWNEPRFPLRSVRTKLNAIDFVDRKTGWAAGGKGKIVSTNDGGKVWREQTSNVTADLFDIAFVDARIGFAVGDSGTIVRTENAGATWRLEATGSKHKLERVSFSGDRGFAVGFGGTILTAIIDRRGS